MPDVAVYKIDQPVVFFPGTLCDERIFNPCWSHLDINMRAFVPLQWAEDLAQMKMLSQDRLDYFEQPVHLVGFSMGGYLAALTALQNKPRIASLTLIGSACNALPKSELAMREKTLGLIKRNQYKGLPEKYLNSYFHPSNQQTDGPKQIVKQMERDLGSSVLAAQMRATQPRENLIPKLAKCDFPIYLIHGEQDNLVSQTTLDVMQQGLPNSQLSLVENAGHMLPIEQPLELAKHLAQFLGQKSI